MVPASNGVQCLVWAKMESVAGGRPEKRDGGARGRGRDGSRGGGGGGVGGWGGGVGGGLRPTALSQITINK